MSVDLDSLLAELNGTPKDEPTEVSTETEEGVPAVLDTSLDTPTVDPLEGFLVADEAADPEPLPEPVQKPKRGRPRKAAPKKVEEVEEVEEVPDETEKVTETVPEETKVEDSVGDAVVVETETTVETSQDFKDTTPDFKDTIGSEKTFYILKATQIINGHPYQRGQKITFNYGDRFYNSQTDRNGTNWLDTLDSYEAQIAHFGSILFEPDTWSGIPIGDTTTIEHPGLAIAVARIAREELERNGTPLN